MNIHPLFLCEEVFGGGRTQLTESGRSYFWLCRLAHCVWNPFGSGPNRRESPTVGLPLLFWRARRLLPATVNDPFAFPGRTARFGTLDNARENGACLNL
jgi:hypothetical protein